MRAYELSENSDLMMEVLVWLIGKGLPEKNARKYMAYVGVEELSNEMNAEKEKEEVKVRKLLAVIKKYNKLNAVKRDNPGHVTYDLISDEAKTVMFGGQRVGTLTKDGNKWTGTINYDNNQHKIGPDTIMKVQDEIDIIAFGIK